MKTLECLNGCGKMLPYAEFKTLNIRGKELTVLVECFKCEVCGLEAGTQQQTGQLQERIIKELEEKP